MRGPIKSMFARREFGDQIPGGFGMGGWAESDE